MVLFWAMHGRIWGASQKGKTWCLLLSRVLERSSPGMRNREAGQIVLVKGFDGGALYSRPQAASGMARGQVGLCREPALCCGGNIPVASHPRKINA